MARHKKSTSKSDYVLSKAVMVSMDSIESPSIAMRSKMDDNALKELADSIRSVGLLQPLVVVQRGDKYRIIAGHRRFIALTMLDKTMASCIILDVSDAAAAFITFHENSFRTDPDVVDEANFLAALKASSGMDNRSIAHHIGRSEQYVSQRLAILNWPPLLMEALSSGKISFSAARELSYVDDPVTLQRYVEYAVTNGITPAVARSWRMQYQAASSIPEAPIPDPETPEVDNTHLAQSITCQACLEPGEISHMTNIWLHRRCWQDISNALLQSGVKKPAGPG